MTAAPPPASTAPSPLPLAGPALDALEHLMDLSWPGLETAEINGWKLRSAGSVTQRANSIWPAAQAGQEPATLPAATLPAATLPAATLPAATEWYTARRQPVIFQLTHRPEHAALESVLDAARYSRQSETLIMTARPARPVTGAGDSGLRIELAAVPSPAWLALWWSVDGRGGDAERSVAERILAATPSLYATACDTDGSVLGTGRLALPKTDSGPQWGGLYSMAVAAEARRRGVATALLEALVRGGEEVGVADFWLLVTAANAGAQALYTRAGFSEVARYHYRQAPLRRAPGAC